MIKVAIIDDHKMFADALKSVLPLYDNIEVIGTADSYQSFLSLIEMNGSELQVMLLDLSLGEEKNGFDVLEYVKNNFPQIKILIISMHKQEAYVKKAKEMGANGFMKKESNAGELVDAIQSIMESDEFYTLLASEANSPFFQLTKSEMQITKLLVEGKSNLDIAQEMNRSKDTIDTHRKNIYKKLEVHSVVDLVKIAIKHGITDI